MVRYKVARLAQLALILSAAFVLYLTFSYIGGTVQQRMRPKYFAQDGDGEGDDDDAGAGPGPSNATVSVDPGQDVFWFVQLTDVHISRFHDPARAHDLVSFCRFLQHVIRPEVVLVSGDLTDAKDSTQFGSLQSELEWQTYRDVRTQCDQGRNWLDLKGNHDTFDVAGLHTKENHFRNYSGAGRPGGSYLATRTVRSGRRVAFVGLDATPHVGLKRPFNFFGMMDPQQWAEATALVKQARQADHAFYFGHYPSSTISQSRNFRQLLRHSVYFCGHLHTMLNAAGRMYTRHASGLLELELGDWRDRRRYRVVAVDRGAMTLADAEYTPQQPNVIVVVTAPKDPTFATREDLHRSPPKEIRALVFADVMIKSVGIKWKKGAKEYVDMQVAQVANMSEPHSLYTLPWDPALFLQGFHKLKFKVILTDGTVVFRQHVFSLDGSQKPFPFMARFLLMLDWLPLTEVLLAAVVSSMVITLTLFKVCHHARLHAGSGARRIRIDRRQPYPAQLAMTLVRKFWILCALDRLFWPLVAVLLYVCFAPLAVGHVLSDGLGVIFAWGIVLLDDLTYLPPDSICMVGAVQLLLIHVPFLFVLANAVDKSYFLALDEAAEDAEAAAVAAMNPLIDGAGDSVAAAAAAALAKKRKRRKKRQQGCCCFPCNLIWEHLGVILIEIVLLYIVASLYFAYGFLATLSPVGLGRVVFTLVLYRRARSLKMADFLEVHKVWPLH